MLLLSFKKINLSRKYYKNTSQSDKSYQGDTKIA